jgi:hypothetical protein
MALPMMPFKSTRLPTRSEHRSNKITLAEHWREHVMLSAWRHAMSRRGLCWLHDTLPLSTFARRDYATSLQVPPLDDSVVLGSGSSLAAQLDAIGSRFVKDILVRRAACAMAELHEAGGFVGHARADDIDLMGNHIGFSEHECHACDDLDIAQAQTRDWILFASSVAPHYETRAGDLAAILFRPMRQLPKLSRQLLLSTVAIMGPLEHIGYRLLGRRIRAMRTALLALRSGLAWQGVPAPRVHDVGSPGASRYALLHYLDSARRAP